MISIKNGVDHSQCHPRRLSKKLDRFFNEHKISINTKRMRILALLICASEIDCRITRFDAEWFGDHCLNTTISQLEAIDGVIVDRSETKRPTRFGKPVDCKEYWLGQRSIEKAKSLLGVNHER